MQKRIAILYDFDYTLSKGYMQEFGLMQELGYDNVGDFFASCDNVFKDRDIDLCLSMLAGILFQAKAKGKIVTREYLQSFGQNIQYFPGVEEWFDKINAVGKDLGYEIEHYVISSGLKEIIEGSSISKHLKRIYSNFYAYSDGVAVWPSQVVNYTSKLQYVYRVRKNVLDNLSELKEINEKMPEEKVLPFENIIYLGDSETDIPSFKVIKNNGGLSICVHTPYDQNSKKIAQKCFAEGRVNVYEEADYRENSNLYNLIKEYITNLAKKY